MTTPKASPFRDPNIPHGERSTYSAKLAGKPFAESIVGVIETTSERYVSTVDARIGADFDISIEQAFLRGTGSISAESYKAESRSSGTLTTREEGFFVGTRHLQFGGSVAPFPVGLMPLVGGMTLLRGLDFTKGAKQTIDLWLAFSVYVPLETKVEKLTVVDVPAGRFDAWQVRVRPSLHVISSILDKVVAGFLPPFVMHFEAASPHRMIAFGFPTGPFPWNPRASIELAG